MDSRGEYATFSFSYDNLVENDPYDAKTAVSALFIIAMSAQELFKIPLFPFIFDGRR